MALAAFVALGIPDGVLGVAWPSIRADVGRPVAALGVLLVAQTTGYLLAAAANGALVARLGTGRLLVSSAGVALVGFAAFTASGSWPAFVLASAAIGAAAGMVDAGVNAHVAVHHGRRAMGLLHASFGIGATVGPLLVTGLLGAGLGWRSAYGLIAVGQAVLLGSFVVTRRAWRAAPGEKDEGAGGRPAPSRPGATAVLTLASFFVYTGLEIATGQWAFSLLTEERGVATTAAGLWVAAYWGGLTGGRLVLAAAAHRVAPSTLLGTAAAGAVVGTAVLWLDLGGTGVLGLPLIGVSLAPVFPTLVSLTPERLGAARAAHAIGYQLAAAGVGAAALPGAIALVIGDGGLEALGPSLAALAVALTALLAAAQLAARPARAGSLA